MGKSKKNTKHISLIIFRKLPFSLMVQNISNQRRQFKGWTSGSVPSSKGEKKPTATTGNIFDVIFIQFGLKTQNYTDVYAGSWHKPTEYLLVWMLWRVQQLLVLFWTRNEGFHHPKNSSHQSRRQPASRGFILLRLMTLDSTIRNYLAYCECVNFCDWKVFVSCIRYDPFLGEAPECRQLIRNSFQGIRKLSREWFRIKEISR